MPTTPTPAAPPPSRATSYRAEHEFGLLLGAFGAALGGWWFYSGRFPALRPWFVGGGLLLVALGALFPRALVLPHRLWMAFAERLARIVTPVVLGLVYFLLVTPIGLLRRLGGADPLARRRSAAPGAGASFWRPYPARIGDPKHFERMF
jgi:hypothetical protein